MHRHTRFPMVIASGLCAIGLAAAYPAAAQGSLSELQQTLCTALPPAAVATASDRECAAVYDAARREADAYDRTAQAAVGRRDGRDAAIEEAQRRRQFSEVERTRHEADRNRLAAIDASAFSEAQKTELRNQRVPVGATAEMARLAWGEPQRVFEIPAVTGNRARWSYQGSRYLYFENGVVTTILPRSGRR